MAVDLRKKLGQNLKRLVSEQALSLEKFAYENGISKGYIYDIAKGRANVSLTMLEKLGRALKTKPQDLIS